MYRVSILLTDKSRILTRFTSPREAKVFMSTVEEFLKSPLVKEIFLINSNKTTPNPQTQRVRGTLWCPYCAGYKKFRKRGKNLFRCERCDMSDQDFSVRRENNILHVPTRMVLKSSFRIRSE